ncbi:uncharacterized protein K489DRAFT_413725 [Dissoconium aciculare CBS 342.82]|uniref:Uncharacterized protein n=1 Tax=Dissoconium aciculare CBS 342.82 TaxID=1314786 RepID=A0A6J3LT22_9PEZI|nr:uncharacterized protein K489DRAFT_413725 [Dissoconium aciculare CBS 342.82]KAF1818434.1 hypothetical protein K489DRAFT_413725 [Dissoconium aciculare CBS 342.82]
MPSTPKLSDAAIAISKALGDQLGVEFGIFGGFAIAVLGGPRESKNIDCVVNCSKEWLVNNLGKIDGFRSTGNSRPDLASFLYGENHVLLECFPTSMEQLETMRVEVRGEKAGLGQTAILDPVLCFKGKLQAAATRAKFSDAVGLLFLEGQHGQMLRDRNKEFNRYHVGMAMKRYPHLELAFVRLGVNMEACKAVAKDVDVHVIETRPPEPHSVQNALLYNMRVA